MALTGTDRGTGNNNSSNSSWTLSPGSNFTAYGAWAVLCIASDNAQNSPAGGTQTITVTDSIGNTWTRRVTASADPGNANAGQEIGIYTTPQNVSLLQTGTVITVTQEDNTTAKTWTIMEIIPTSVEFQLSFVAANAGSATTNTAPTVTTSSSITSGNMLVASVALEGGITQVITQDGDSTNGAWSAQQVSQVGATTGGSCCASQRKIVTGTATQTYNPTLTLNADAICGWVEITETAISLRDPIQDGGVLPFSR